MKDQRKYERNYCSRLFGRSEHKIRHERTHTKEKPFVCGCKDSFARLDLLKRHKRLVHKDDSNKSPDMAASAVESLDVKSWKDPSQQPVGGNSTDPRLDGVPDSIDQRNQVEALALSFGSGCQYHFANLIPYLLVALPTSQPVPRARSRLTLPSQMTNSLLKSLDRWVGLLANL
ncbi:uncharacterized protein PG986_014322 [Apiospora aurea]|uniref:C2H2-type domain-containing protein n=1 Tax=Apiospora aurea TaxID=335848 RepID=A0ABR1PSM9_9PEZI